MRRLAAALGFFLILALAGCASSDITDGWHMMAAAQQFRPAAGTCHESAVLEGATSDKTGYRPVPCTGPHMSETVAVFDLAPADAATTDKALAKAWSECSKRATAFLAGDWRTGWTAILPMLPSAEGWSGGARWARCDVVEVAGLDRLVVSRKGTMKGALKLGGKLRLSCANPTINNDDVLTGVKAVPCSTAHHAEFAGLFVTKKKNWTDLTLADKDKGCYPVIAKFAGVPSSDVQYRAGWVIIPPLESEWQRGDHAIRCFLWLDDRTATGSYRKAGTGKLSLN
jgi:hypothetical protein